MSPGTANRLRMAWSVVLLAAIIGTLWISTQIASGFDDRDILTPLRSRIAELESAKARIEPVATQLEESAEVVSVIARRQLPRSPFGLAEPPFVQEMRQREEALLATLGEVRDRLRISNRELLDLRQQIDEKESAIRSDLDEADYQIGLLREVLAMKSDFLGLALAIIAAAAALSIFVSAWRRERRKQEGAVAGAKN